MIVCINIIYFQNQKLTAELKSLSIYSLSDALAKLSSKKGKKNITIGSSPGKSPLKGAVSPIAELTEKEKVTTDDKPIRRTVSFTNSVSVFGENDENVDSHSSSSPKKIKRTQSSERFTHKERRSSLLSNRYWVFFFHKIACPKILDFYYFISALFTAGTTYAYTTSCKAIS